ncbi:ATP-binding protein [uncultured Thiodictyon sp.]|uniref:AAA family ATPase n=1 Tax=uncultured Thiodictyon sp. TaxID=1846217 RepID=UPI0025EFC6D9|nr:ATP-binding protein [uncultured Thiodictyon sp.]
MLHSYRFANAFSFLDETEVSFQVNRHVQDSGLIAQNASGARLSKVMAVVGANASGKTNLLKPLAFLNWFVGGSFQVKPDAKIPIDSHFFADSSTSTFQLIGDMAGDIWRYELELIPERVLREALYKKTSRSFSFVFVREWNPKTKNYDITQQGFGFSAREAGKVRQNASLISTAAQYGVPLAVQFAGLSFRSNVEFSGRNSLDGLVIVNAMEVFKRTGRLRLRMVDLLKDWDLGLADVVFRKIATTEPSSGTKAEVDLPFAVHRNGERKVEQLLMQESSGTQSAFVLLSQILPVLMSGGVAVIDELEANLHPHMLHPLLGLFLDPEINPYNAQVIFTCHASEVLNLLTKAQVMLVEKDAGLFSHAWRIDTMRGVRADDNLYAKYMAGAYGAVPGV